MAFIFERIRRRLINAARNISGAKSRSRAATFAAFDARLAALGPGDLAIDLGANVGIFTAKMVATGADVIAFEPDPHAFAQLEANVTGDNLTLHAAAAGAEATTLKLYRRKGFDAIPDRATTSSSLFASKDRIDADHSVDVEVIDFPEFLASLDRPVKLMKIDIEGAEVALLEALLDHPIAAKIDAIFVETHEKVLPELAARTRALKARRGDHAEIFWDWH